MFLAYISLVLGIGRDETFLASDVTAILAHTRQVNQVEHFEKMLPRLVTK